MDCLIDRLNSSRCPRKTLPSLAEAPFSPDTHRLSVAFFTSLTPETLCEVVKYRLLVEMAAALPGSLAPTALGACRSRKNPAE